MVAAPELHLHLLAARQQAHGCMAAFWQATGCSHSIQHQLAGYTVLPQPVPFALCKLQAVGAGGGACVGCNEGLQMHFLLYQTSAVSGSRGLAWRLDLLAEAFAKVMRVVLDRGMKYHFAGQLMQQKHGLQISVRWLALIQTTTVD